MIEIDGSQHFTKDSQEYDEIRTNFFEGLDIEVLRFTNAEINTNIDGVVQKIMMFWVFTPSLVKEGVGGGNSESLTTVSYVC